VCVCVCRSVGLSVCVCVTSRQALRDVRPTTLMVGLSALQADLTAAIAVVADLERDIASLEGEKLDAVRELAEFKR
jgi:hypothetical protein